MQEDLIQFTLRDIEENEDDDMFHGIIPPIATPLAHDESIDIDALRRLIELNIAGGVHGIWVLGTTGRFDLVTDGEQRRLAEHVCEFVDGQVPLILNVSDMGTKRVIEKAAAFDDLPYDAYAVLCPWYRDLSRNELSSFFFTLADELSKPVVLYNAPWVCNMLSFDHLQELAEHPRIVGVKDVTTDFLRPTIFTKAQRQVSKFCYLHGTSLIHSSISLGADGFVNGLSGLFPELFVACWNASIEGDATTANQLQTQIVELTTGLSHGPELTCLEVMARYRNLGHRTNARPVIELDAESVQSVLQSIERSDALHSSLVSDR